MTTLTGDIYTTDGWAPWRRYLTATEAAALVEAVRRNRNEPLLRLVERNVHIPGAGNCGSSWSRHDGTITYGDVLLTGISDAAYFEAFRGR